MITALLSCALSQSCLTLGSCVHHIRSVRCLICAAVKRQISVVTGSYRINNGFLMMIKNSQTVLMTLNPSWNSVFEIKVLDLDFETLSPREKTTN